MLPRPSPLSPPTRRGFSGRHLSWLALPLLLVVLGVQPASAHVKWFCAYDVPAQPVLLEEVLNHSFLWMALVSVAGLFLGTIFDRTIVIQHFITGLNVLTSHIRVRSEALMRGCYGAFFVALFTIGNIIMTPELTTTLTWVPVVQAFIAIGFLFRRTMVLSALGIVALYITGLQAYGLFHMMDYPIFLGAALYFAVVGLGVKKLGNLRPVDILRWGAAITLMWASVEKWAYPNWTFPLLITHARMTMGLDPNFYMTAAGLVEFGFAFALICRPLASRCAAIFLIGLFTSAILEFGKIDAIGHLPIIIILLVIAADDRPVRVPSRSAVVPAAIVPAVYAGALAFTILFYYSVHAYLFGTHLV